MYVSKSSILLIISRLGVNREHNNFQLRATPVFSDIYV